MSMNGDGDSGGSETSETGVNGCTCGGDHPNRPLETIISDPSQHRNSKIGKSFSTEL
ncbi:hypothetical protein MtrunA17_Chr1g0212721 [Medicago truncatula]|uniref:Uncharacterized protein n=1 Tax=Medicago truncatula TaxID=3880 RepID=A0A396JWI8_MEDTR|nr:hypothetical protein MtrunA17_Chr1g0212721 [Medicago truncatula]